MPVSNISIMSIKVQGKSGKLTKRNERFIIRKIQYLWELGEAGYLAQIARLIN